MTTGSLDAPLTALDESYTHQLVAPRSVTARVSPSWQERSYHLLFTDGGVMVNVGRAVWPYEGVRRAFVGVSDGEQQQVVRAEQPFAPGDDADDPAVEDVAVEVLEPLRALRLRAGAPGDPLALDLTWTARFAPVATAPNRIVVRDEVVTDYMNFFQSGTFDGWVELGGRRHEVSRRAGFRDRGWGVRKHEGAPRRGLVVAAFCELPDAALYLILYEGASGRRGMSNGWLVTEDGVDPIVSIEHDLEFEDALLQRGRFRTRTAAGRSLEVAAVVASRLFLAGVGYAREPRFTDPGREGFAVGERDVRELLRGQTDHGAVFEVDGVAGHGYVETGLGTHVRYAPED
jgi:hypothetical protein